MSTMKKRWRKARREIRQMQRSFDEFRETAHQALFGRALTRWGILALLLALAASSVVGMARVNAQVEPTRNMKWFMGRDNVVVAAPPMDPVAFDSASR